MWLTLTVFIGSRPGGKVARPCPRALPGLPLRRRMNAEVGINHAIVCITQDLAARSATASLIRTGTSEPLAAPANIFGSVFVVQKS